MTGRVEKCEGEGHGKPTVQLVGRWGFLLKAHLTMVSMLVPFMLGWAVWVTRGQYEDAALRQSGELFTRSDGLVLEAKVKTETLSWANKLDDRLDDLDRDNAKILQTLEFLKTKMP